MTFNHRAKADQFAKIMKRAGAEIDYRVAGTGTIYVTVDGAYKARFADHGECYCHENISVDPYGCSVEQAVRAAARELDLDVSRSLASFKAAATRARRLKVEDEKAAAPALAAAKKREEDRAAFQRAYIEANHPDYEARTTKSRKRIRAKANKEFEAQYA